MKAPTAFTMNPTIHHVFGSAPGDPDIGGFFSRRRRWFHAAFQPALCGKLQARNAVQVHGVSGLLDCCGRGLFRECFQIDHGETFSFDFLNLTFDDCLGEPRQDGLAPGLFRIDAIKL